MRILVVNPNSTAAMTESIAAAARAAAGPRAEITAMNPEGGPPAIEGPDDGAAALPGLFALFEREVIGRDAYDAAVIACFDDTGLWELKARAAVPVIGVGEAGFQAAMLLGHRFSVVTTLPVSLPVIEGNLKRYGYVARCARLRASGVPVLDLEHAKESAEAAVSAEVERAFAEDDCDSVVLGCAGMAALAARMAERFGKPVIDGVAAAVALAMALDLAAASARR